jgi:hypothetical protein
MTRNRTSRGRHRRGRNRPPDGMTPGPVDAAEAPAVTEQPAAEPAPRRPVEADVADPSRSGRPATRGTQRGRDGQGGDGAGPRPGPGRNRRRNQRRSQVIAAPGEVLKANAPISGPPEPMASHSLEAMSGEGEPVFGCPMLTRTRLGLPVTGGVPAPRCALGWALHSETEAAYCLETPDLVQCWKAHPERLEEIRARLGEAVTAAD